MNGLEDLDKPTPVDIFDFHTKFVEELSKIDSIKEIENPHEVHKKNERFISSFI